MVPKDPRITDLRISLVFRHCDKRWVKPNEYHYDWVSKGRGKQKMWTKGKSIPLRDAAQDESHDAESLSTEKRRRADATGEDVAEKSAKRKR